MRHSSAACHCAVLQPWHEMAGASIKPALRISPPWKREFPCSEDRRYAEYCEGIRWQGKSTPRASLGRVRVPASRPATRGACHGQMRSTHDVSPQLLTILLWTCGWCCPGAVNPWAATYQELPTSRETICQVSGTPPGRAACLAGIVAVEMGAKIGECGPQANLPILDLSSNQPNGRFCIP